MPVQLSGCRSPVVTSGHAHDMSPSNISHAHGCLCRQGEVDADELVFFANWQCQAGAAVHCASRDPGERRHLAANLQDLQQQIIEGRRFFREVEQVGPHKGGLPENRRLCPSFPATRCWCIACQWHAPGVGVLSGAALVFPACVCALQAPERQATVEVACALEGLAHCLQASLADAAAAAPAIQQQEEQERKQLQLYAECAAVACRFLLEAQVGDSWTCSGDSRPPLPAECHLFLVLPQLFPPPNYPTRANPHTA